MSEYKLTTMFLKNAPVHSGLKIYSYRRLVQYIYIFCFINASSNINK